MLCHVQLQVPCHLPRQSNAVGRCRPSLPALSECGTCLFGGLLLMMLYPYSDDLEKPLARLQEWSYRGTHRRPRGFTSDYSQDSCSSQHLSIKWVEGFAFVRTAKNRAHIWPTKFRAEPLCPPRSGFCCKGTWILVILQPSKDSIF